MRGIFFFIIMLVSPFSRADLYADRGFLLGSCYREIVQITKSGVSCDLELFSTTQAHLSLRLIACPENMDQSNWYRAEFKVVTGQNHHQRFAQILKATVKDRDLSVKAIQYSTGLGTLIPCLYTENN